KSANVAFTFGGDPGTVGGVKLLTNVSAGTVTNVTNLGGGQLGGLYTPPAATQPQVALVTAADAADPTRTYAAVAVPLSAKLDHPVTVAPNSRVILKVGGRDFGPVPADSKGRAKVPIVVPPGATTATRVQITPDGAVSEEPLDLKLPEARRVAMFPTFAGLPSDARLQVPVRAFVVTPDGRPDENANVAFSASAGTVSPARHEGAGIYVATYTPPTANVAGKATITAKLADKAPVHADSRVVPLVPVRPTKLALSAAPIPAGATAVPVTAKVTGPDGAPLAGRALSFAADGARLEGVKDLKNGEYVATFTPTGKGPVGVTASAAAVPAGNALARVLLVPARERLPADGLSSTLLTVLTVDELGAPVPNVEVDLRLVTGDGSLPERATTDQNGAARVYYTAGRKHGFVGIDAAATASGAGTRTAGVSLVQAPPSLTLPDLPVAAAAPTRAFVDEAAGAIAEMRVERAP
ncbi:MAG: Ig-like domain-containing protein, partial [Myxococcota bacterium]